VRQNGEMGSIPKLKSAHVPFRVALIRAAISAELDDLNPRFFAVSASPQVRQETDSDILT
jgi:hypothetical protein